MPVHLMHEAENSSSAEFTGGGKLTGLQLAGLPPSEDRKELQGKPWASVEEAARSRHWWKAPGGL